MTTNHIDRIFSRYAEALHRFSNESDSITSDAVLLGLALALQELAADMQQDNADADDQLARIERVLEAHDSALFADVASGRTPLSTAIDALIVNERAAFAALTSDLRAAQSVDGSLSRVLTDLGDWLYKEMPAVLAGAGDIEIVAGALQAIKQLHADNAMLAQELAARRQMTKDLEHDNARLTQEIATLRSYTLAPKPSDYPTPILTAEEAEAQTAPGKTLPALVLLRQAALSSAANDYWIGLDANRWSWRVVPKSLRLEMVRFVISTTPNGSQSEFDAARPAWMATASSHVQTFGMFWSILSDLTREIEVPA